MEYNLLDRIVDEDNYGPDAGEFLLRGMSRAGQEQFIHDLSQKIGRKAKRNRIDFDAAELEQRIKRMPEDAQDAWLRSANSAKIKFENGLLEASHYNPEKNTITMVDGIARHNTSPSVMVHEVGHHVASNVNGRTKRRFVGKDSDGNKVYMRTDASVLNDYGNEYGRSVNQLFVPVANDFNGKTYLDGKASLEKAKEVVDANFPSSNALDKDYMAHYLMDPFELGQMSEGFFVEGDGGHPVHKKYGHGVGYGSDKKRISENLYESEDFSGDPSLYKRYQKNAIERHKRKDFSMPENERNFFSEAMRKRDNAVRNAAQSIEGFPTTYEFITEPEGLDVVKNRMTPAYNKFMDIVSKDRRVGRFVPPSRKYADEEGLRLIEERERKLAERRARRKNSYDERFMALPEDKRNYYDEANVGDVLWMRDPNINPGEDGNSNLYWIVKGDPSQTFQGDRLKSYGRRNPDGTFFRPPFSIDLNHLSPTDANVKLDDILKEIIDDEANGVKKRIEKRNRRR